MSGSSFLFSLACRVLSSCHGDHETRLISTTSRRLAHVPVTVTRHLLRVLLQCMFVDKECFSPVSLLSHDQAACSHWSLLLHTNTILPTSREVRRVSQLVIGCNSDMFLGSDLVSEFHSMHSRTVRKLRVSPFVLFLPGTAESCSVWQDHGSVSRRVKTIFPGCFCSDCDAVSRTRSAPCGLKPSVAQILPDTPVMLQFL